MMVYLVIDYWKGTLPLTWLETQAFPDSESPWQKEDCVDGQAMLPSLWRVLHVRFRSLLVRIL